MPSRKGFLIAWICLLLLGGLLTRALLQVRQADRAMTGQAWNACHEQTRRAAGQVDQLLEELMAQAHRIAGELASGQLRPRDLPPRLARALASAPPSAYRVGVLFEPYTADPQARLFGPYLERAGPGLRAFRYEGTGDYTRLDWYRYDLGVRGWNEPRRDPGTGILIVDYSEPVRLPGASGASGASGVVRIEVSLKDIQRLVGGLSPGSSGYGFLLSAKGIYLADPLDSNVRDGVFFGATPAARQDPGRRGLAEAALAHRAAFAPGRSAVTGQATWMFLEPVAASHWSLGTMIITDELNLVPPGLNRTLARIVTLALGTALALLHLLLGLWRPTGARLWAFSAGGSLLIAAATGWLWHFAYSLHQAPRNHEVEVMSVAGRTAYLKEHGQLGAGLDSVAAAQIPVGLFIQTMELGGDSQMKISGQVWERCPKDFPAADRGLIFPEASACDLKETFTKREGDSDVVVYSFRGVFRMAGDGMVNYPFDNSSVRLRIWPRAYYSNTLLVPDLEAYTLLIPTSLPGIDRDLSLAGWRLGQSHFSFLDEGYNTNFGIDSYVGQQDSPELAYAFTLKRNFLNPFIATFLPILVVVGLLFALLMTTTRIKEQVSITGYNTMNVLRSVISLFFPVVIAQINLRNHILTEGLLYVKYYYFLVYCLILLVAVDALVVSHSDHPAVHGDDHRMAKLLYWPLLSASFYAISLLYLR